MTAQAVPERTGDIAVTTDSKPLKLSLERYIRTLCFAILRRGLAR
ncbi:hypothetical Protein YC6258_00993 [Gynuella sunshinyii YC6258]|uniref:Uncharacterized protein n=1 Tax=Gynuella sunshinyii YC6258 TaxID=1445510 RepID=A0A0C5VI52_9GAMM|nr:hypothetical Protein YC6258_00993 [Gynuella sunshinyii YC6258]